MARITHQALQFGWENLKIESPKTIVLGSFNPYNPNGDPVDYFYGRISNHFWASVARILDLPEDSFLGPNSLPGKLAVMQNRFICMDVIDILEIESDDTATATNYIDRNIFRNYLDQNIWTSNPRSSPLKIRRTYNSRILEYLNNSSVKNVIHTMGVNRIGSYNDIKPSEKALGIHGFGDYMRSIVDSCEEKEINFCYDSLSPSDYAVKTGKTRPAALDRWLKENLFM
jgi:hypothetical protein